MFYRKKKPQKPAVAVSVAPSPPRPPPRPRPPPAAAVKLKQSAGFRSRPIQNKVAMWKSRFPWLIFKRAELQPNYVYCKYCEMRVYCPTDKVALKHQRTSKHVRARIQIARQNKLAAPPIESKRVEESRVEKIIDDPNTSLPSWVTDIEGDYGLCKYCNVRLHIKQSVSRERHQLTAKHKAAVLEYSKQNCDTNENDDNASKNMECDTVVVEDDNVSVK